MWLSIERKGGNSQPFRIRADQWTYHSSADVAVVPALPSNFDGGNIDWNFWPWDKGAIGREQAIEKGVSEVDEIAVIGFPKGHEREGGEELFDLHHPLVRVGILSQVRGWLRGERETFVIDCPIFDGNSGGVVCLVPTNVAVGSTKPQQNSFLIGMVAKKFSANVSKTGHTALDLGQVVPIDYVNATIDMALADN